MKRTIKYIPVLLLGILLNAGCTGDFEEMNTNPNSVTSVDPSLLLPKMEREAINGGYATYQCGENLHANQYAQYVSNSASYFSSDRYEYHSGWATYAYWTPYYTYVLKDLIIIKEKALQEPKYEQMYQIARIITAIGTARTTDIFGDVPYSEASLGNEQPTYDSTKDIYYAIFNELTEAVTALSGTFTTEQLAYGSEDIIYNGDVAKWIKLANSLRLRYALRLSFVDPDKAKAEGEAALSAELLSSIDDNAALETSILDNDGIGHPFYTICYWNEFRMSSTFETAYKTLSTVVDPRMECYWGVTEASVEAGTPDFKGLDNGLSTTELTLAGNTAKDNSNIWGLLWAPEWNSGVATPSDFRAFPYYTMCYSEVCFLKAEAAIRNWDGAGDAQSNYEDGIRASFLEARLNVDPTLYSTANDEPYISGGSVAWNDADGFEAKLEKVATQKWIALFPNGTEAWAEVRRTGYPKLNPIAHSEDNSINPANGEFIKKLRYVDTEVTYNADHATDPALNGGKGDGQNVRVWWDTERYE